MSRSPQKIEYTSCISTTIPSPTSTTTYHSSFDFISEPRDCDTLGMINTDNTNQQQLQHVKLERDLRQLDLNSVHKEKKIRKLDRTESISLPTTPTKQMSPTFEYKYPHLTALKRQSENVTIDDDEPSSLCCKSPIEYNPPTPDPDVNFDESMTSIRQ